MITIIEPLLEDLKRLGIVSEREISEAREEDEWRLHRQKDQIIDRLEESLGSLSEEELEEYALGSFSRSGVPDSDAGKQEDDIEGEDPDALFVITFDPFPGIFLGVHAAFDDMSAKEVLAEFGSEDLIKAIMNIAKHQLMPDAVKDILTGKVKLRVAKYVQIAKLTASKGAKKIRSGFGDYSREIGDINHQIQRKAKKGIMGKVFGSPVDEKIKKLIRKAGLRLEDYESDIPLTRGVRETLKRADLLNPNLPKTGWQKVKKALIREETNIAEVMRMLKDSGYVKDGFADYEDPEAVDDDEEIEEARTRLMRVGGRKNKQGITVGGRVKKVKTKKQTASERSEGRRAAKKYRKSSAGKKAAKVRARFDSSAKGQTQARQLEKMNKARKYIDVEESITYGSGVARQLLEDIQQEMLDVAWGTLSEAAESFYVLSEVADNLAGHFVDLAEEADDEEKLANLGGILSVMAEEAEEIGDAVVDGQYTLPEVQTLEGPFRDFMETINDSLDLLKLTSGVE